jgi:hypothetical protein
VVADVWPVAVVADVWPVPVLGDVAVVDDVEAPGVGVVPDCVTVTVFVPDEPHPALASASAAPAIAPSIRFTRGRLPMFARAREGVGSIHEHDHD